MGQYGHYKLTRQLYYNPRCGWCNNAPASREFAEIADMIRRVDSYRWDYGKWCWLYLPDEKYIDEEDGKEYEDFIDAYMIYKKPKRRIFTQYANLPTWFPKAACEDCGKYLLPFVWQLTDIWLLSKAASEDGGRYARCDDWDSEHKDYRAAPFALSEYSPVSFERLFGHREGDDGAQAVEEHQREPVFRDEDCDV